MTTLHFVVSALAIALCVAIPARAQELGTPRWVTAVCGEGASGPVHETEIRNNGEIRVRATPSMRDTLIGRDPSTVLPLLKKAGQLEWTKLRSQSARPGKWCMLMATWRQERRGLKWYGNRTPDGFFEVAMLHDEIERLGGGFYDSQPYLESSCSGGYTGGGGGSIITRDGRMYHWQMETYATPHRYTFDGRDFARAAKLFEEAERIGFLRTEFREPGNMSCSLSLISGEMGHTVVWPMFVVPSRISAIAKLAENVRR